MSELKTIKEVCKLFWNEPEGSKPSFCKCEGHKYGAGTASGQWVYKELRKEAKKWIEKLREESIQGKHGDPMDKYAECNNDGNCGDAGSCVDCNYQIILFIKNRFNLKDEDE